VKRVNKKTLGLLVATIFIPIIGTATFATARQDGGPLWERIWNVFITGGEVTLEAGTEIAFKTATKTIVAFSEAEFGPEDKYDVLLNVDGYKTIHIASITNDNDFFIVYEAGVEDTTSEEIHYYYLDSTDHKEILSFQVKGPWLKISVERNPPTSGIVTVVVYAQSN